MSKLLNFITILLAAAIVSPTAPIAQISLPNGPPGDGRPGIKVDKCFRTLGTDPIPLPIPIPVGCDSSDCCPGCGDGPLDWKLRLSGTENVQVSLAFDGLAREAASRLQSVKTYAGSAPNRLNLSNGEMTIEGIGHSADQDVPIATAHLELRADIVRSLRVSLGSPDRTLLPSEIIRLDVTQMLGPVVVNEARIDVRVSECMAPPVRFETDFIRLENNRGARRASIWLDARLNPVGCENDLPVCLTKTSSIRNIRSGCSKEAIAFSEDDGAVWKLAKWKDPPGDSLRISFPQMINVPIRAWVLDPQFSAVEQIIQADVQLANALYNSEGCGVRFTLTDVVDASSDPQAIEIQSGARDVSCSALKSRIGFTDGIVNVYYLDFSNQPPSFRPAGFACTVDPDDTGCGKPYESVLMVNAFNKNPESLAHELGHLFSLMHSTCYESSIQSAFNANNLMLPRPMGMARNVITAAQCFRVNSAALSWLNTGELRDGPTRACVQSAAIGSSNRPGFVPAVDNPQCPEINNDIRFDAAIPSEIPTNQIYYPCGDIEAVAE